MAVLLRSWTMTKECLRSRTAGPGILSGTIDATLELSGLSEAGAGRIYSAISTAC